jgi:hypothetical protein
VKVFYYHQLEYEFYFMIESFIIQGRIILKKDVVILKALMDASKD